MRKFRRDILSAFESGHLESLFYGSSGQTQFAGIVAVSSETKADEGKRIVEKSCLALAFCPGDRHVIAATKAGNLEIFNLGSGELVESINDHGL